MRYVRLLTVKSTQSLQVRVPLRVGTPGAPWVFSKSRFSSAPCLGRFAAVIRWLCRLVKRPYLNMPGQQGQNSAIKESKWCVCACACLPRSVFVSAGEGAPSYSTAVASGLLVGGFAVTWTCTTSSSGVKVPANVQRNINGKPAPQKRRRQPLCRALRCPVLAPSFGKKTGASLDLDWPELEPDCPGRPTDRQATAQH